jgi:hypothetical protein
MVTKGVFMVICGIGGLTISIIFLILLFVSIKKREQNYLNNINTTSNKSKSSNFSQGTDAIATDNIFVSPKGTDILNESGTGSDVLMPEKHSGVTGTDALILQSNQNKS